MIGKTEGSFCRGFIVEMCSTIQVDAVSPNGWWGANTTQMFELPTEYDWVREYRAGDEGKAGMRRSSPSTGWIAWAMGSIPVYLKHNGGDPADPSNYEQLGTPEYLVFQCEKH